MSVVFEKRANYRILGSAQARQPNLDNRAAGGRTLISIHASAAAYPSLYLVSLYDKRRSKDLIPSETHEKGE